MGPLPAILRWSPGERIATVQMPISWTSPRLWNESSSLANWMSVLRLTCLSFSQANRAVSLHGMFIDD